MIRNTGVSTRPMTIAMSTKSVSHTSLRRWLAQWESRVRTLGMFFSSSPLCLPDHGDGPQHSDRQKRKQVYQQIPAAVTRWRSFYRRACLGVSFRALQPDPHAPELFSVEVYEGAIL